MKAANPLTLPLEGVSLVEASAGTGKTTALVRTYLRALLSTELTIDKLLVVTFTRAATGELTTRIRSALAEVHAVLNGDAKPNDFLIESAGRIRYRRRAAAQARACRLHCARRQRRVHHSWFLPAHARRHGLRGGRRVRHRAARRGAILARRDRRRLLAPTPGRGRSPRTRAGCSIRLPRRKDCSMRCAARWP